MKKITKKASKKKVVCKTKAPVAMIKNPVYFWAAIISLVSTSLFYISGIQPPLAYPTVILASLLVLASLQERNC